MKNQALFSLKDKSKQLKCRLLQFSFGTLRVNIKTLLVFAHCEVKVTRGVHLALLKGIANLCIK